MKFPITLTPAEEGGFVVTFPDIPEAITQGSDRNHALEMGLDALITSLDFYFEDRRTVPAPSAMTSGDDYVELPASVTAKVLLLNEMIAARLDGPGLARKMGRSNGEIEELLDLHQNTMIDSVASALRATGKTLELQVV